MALPSTGVITAEMINAELGRSANAPFSLNDTAVRALAGKASGAISFADLRGKSSEIVKYVTASRGSVGIKDYFTEEEWASDTAKRLVINSGVEIGDTWNYAALEIQTSSRTQAQSFKNALILENNGFISGRGGAGNSGNGGTALIAHILGRDGQKLQIRNNGTIRGGGGGGGRGGNGGTGGNGVYSSQSTVREPSSGENYAQGSTFWEYSPGWGNARVVWGGSVLGAVWPATATSMAFGGWTYFRGGQRRSWYDDDGAQYIEYGIYRTGTTTVNNYTTGGGGGAGGNGGQGEGYGQVRTSGFNGAAGSSGGANAGAGGQGGWGGQGGKWGAAGETGVAGSAGAAGNNGGGAAGAGGAGGGAAGCYIDGASRVTWLATGTRQGRSIN